MTKDKLLNSNVRLRLSNSKGQTMIFEVSRVNGPLDMMGALVVRQIPDNARQKLRYVGALDTREQRFYADRNPKNDEARKSIKIAAWLIKKILHNQPIPDKYSLQIEQA